MEYLDYRLIKLLLVQYYKYIQPFFQVKYIEFFWNRVYELWNNIYILTGLRDPIEEASSYIR